MKKSITRGYIDATDGQGGLAPTPHGRSTFSKNVGGKKDQFGTHFLNRSRKCKKIEFGGKNPINLGNDHSILHVLLTPDLNR